MIKKDIKRLLSGLIGNLPVVFKMNNGDKITITVSELKKDEIIPTSDIISINNESWGNIYNISNIYLSSIVNPKDYPFITSFIYDIFVFLNTGRLVMLRRRNEGIGHVLPTREYVTVEEIEEKVGYIVSMKQNSFVFLEPENIPEKRFTEYSYWDTDLIITDTTSGITIQNDAFLR